MAVEEVQALGPRLALHDHPGTHASAGMRAFAAGTKRGASTDGMRPRGRICLYPDVAGQRLSFEIAEDSGFPFRLRDRETGTDWDLTGAAVTGPLTGTRLNQVATYSATWFAWAAFHRDTDLFVP